MTTAAVTHAVQLFGPPTFRSGEEAVVFLPDKRHQLLAYLAYRGTWVSRESLADMFWTGNSETVRGNLRRLLGRVQELPWLTGLEVERSRVRWAVPTDVAASVARPEWVLELYQGPLLQGLDSYEDSGFGGWLELERERLHGEWRSVVLRDAALKEQNEQRIDAARRYLRLLKQDPFDEEALQLYLSSAAQTGQVPEARRAYDTFAKLLDRELGVEPTSRTIELAAALESPASSAVASLPAATVKLHALTLPTSSSSFVGRDLELAEIARTFSGSITRLLTILGPGGVGKTRLALQAASELRGQFAKVYFVPLEATMQAGQLTPTVAAALGVDLDSGEDIISQITNALGTERVLLVLDNFEHIVERAPLVSELLDLCPSLRVIATSRERLNLTEEMTLQLRGLGLPSAKASAEETEQADGVRLFGARAKKASSNFALTSADLPSVLEICQLVEGLPLAIELAAAWTRALPCAEIAEEIRSNLDFLASATRNVKERQRSVRATFEYSWSLLTPSEQHLLQKLSVFRGGFTREAAVSVTGANLALLLALVDKSLLQFFGERFHFHPLLQQYAQEKLADDEVVAAETSKKHALYMLHLAETVYRSSEHEQQALGRLEEELENLRAAMEWSLFHPESVYPLRFAALSPFWLTYGRVDEGRTYITQALNLPLTGNDTLSLIMAMSEAGRLASVQGDIEAAQKYFERMLGAAEKAGAESEAARARLGLGHIAMNQGNLLRALTLLEQAQATFDSGARQEDLSTLLRCLSFIKCKQGDYAAAKSYVTEAMNIDRISNNTTQISLSLVNLGVIAWFEGDLERATEHFREGGRIARLTPYALALVSALNNLSALLLDLGDYASAASLLKETLELRSRQTDLWGLLYTLENRACLAAAEGEFAKATFLWGAAERLSRETGLNLEEFWRERRVRYLEMAKSGLDKETFQNSYGTGMTQTTSEVLKIVASSL